MFKGVSLNALEYLCITDFNLKLETYVLYIAFTLNAVFYIEEAEGRGNKI